MRIAFLIFSFLAILTACGSNESKDKKESSGDSTAQTMTPEQEKGMNLVVNNTCFQCHDISTKKIGPPYEAVAEKYPESPAITDSLVNHIINGSIGRWGTVPMPANPAVADSDARFMVQYILSLK